jgi:hypothetical protein
MRWVVVPLGLLVLVSLGLLWWEGGPPTAGAVLAGAVDRDAAQPPLGRGAIPLIDFVPPAADDPTMAAVMAMPVQRGEGGLPGRTLTALPGQRWVESNEATFVWQAAPSNPLRATLCTTARDRLRGGLAHVGLSAEQTEAALAGAMADLATTKDADLLQDLLKSDRAVLVMQTDWRAAVREALLLATRPDGAPVLTFPRRGSLVYAFAQPSETQRAALELQAYDPASRELQWVGTVQVRGTGGPPPPTRVRGWMVRFATLATGNEGE